jgi:predicted nucleic acid-binding protein
MFKALLQEFICQPVHRFWDDTISLVDSRKFTTLPGSKNLTNYYLLALAIKNSGKIVTFDQRIDSSLLQGGISFYHVIQDNSGE